MNNKVKFLRGTATEYEASTKDNDTFYYTTDDEKLYLGNKEITGGGVTIDDTLSDTSKNPVQNKVINAALNSKANLSDIPTTLPANGGNADTLGGKHKSDFVENLLNQNHHFSMVYGDHAYITNTIDNNVPNLPIVSNYTHIIDRLASGEVETVLSVGTDYTDKVYVYRKKDGIWKSINADTLDGKHASDFALKTDIPTTLPANGGIADTARQTVSPNAKVRLWEDSEGGNLHLESPDGNHSVEMDLYNNSFRMFFTDNGELTFPVDYNSTTKKFNINGNAATAITLSDWSGSVVENADDAPLGLSKIDANGANNPFKFWAEILTLGETGNQSYRQQWAFPWSSSEAPLKPKYRVKDSGEWGPWQKLNDGGNAATANFATYSDYAGGSVQSTASNVCLRNISAGTGDLTAGSSPLANGAIYLVYE